MKRIKKPNGYWNLRKNCINNALNYKTRTEWANKSLLAYTSARKNGWLNICCKHMIPVGSSYRRLIYSFEFSDKSVYVGLTYNPELRKKTHLYDINSSVYKHIKKFNLKPKFKIITKYLDKETASIKECEILKKYKNNNWNILNKGKPGGLGGSILKWTKEKCIEEGKKYICRSDFKKHSSGAYYSSNKNNWLDKCCAHMITIKKHNNYWFKNRCFIEALKYRSKIEWKIKSTSSYSAAVKNKWINECSTHMEKPISQSLKWTKEKCIEKAKKYKTKKCWIINAESSYRSALKNKWIDECCKHMKLK